MIFLGVIGAGHHCRAFHLPAIRAFQARFPNTVQLSVLCDRDLSLAQQVAHEFGFASVESDYLAMCRNHKLDGCLVLTPPGATLAAAQHILENSQASLLIEKPLGRDLEQAKSFIESIGHDQRRVMVSLNRRFDPALVAAAAWLKDRQVDYLRVTMARIKRSEADFMWTTGIHVIDAAIAMTAQPKKWNAGCIRHDGSLHGQVTFRVGATEVRIDILPVTGDHQESFEFFGHDFSVKVVTGQVNTCGLQAWERGALVINQPRIAGSDEYLVNGTSDETRHFIAALQGTVSLYPSVLDVLTATRICSELQSAADNASPKKPATPSTGAR